MYRICYISLLLLFSVSLVAQNNHPPKRHRYGLIPELLRGPYIQVATPGSVLIRWRTDEADISRVRYGTEPGKPHQVITDSTRVWEHQVTISSLQPLTRYYYQIEAQEDTLQGDEHNYFTTLPLAGATGNYRIGVFGDCGNNSLNQRNTLAQFEKYLGNDLLNAWILLGDNAYSFGKDAEYQSNFFNIYKDRLLKTSPLFPAPGNHDYHDLPFSAEHAQRSKEVAYFQNFSMPANAEAGGVPSHTQAFYSFDVGNIHFLSLDSHGQEDSASRLFDTLGRQVRWIKEDLEANKNKTWVVAYWHHPPYSMGSHNSDTETQMVKIRQNFVRILERYGVDLILCGHSHSYERTRLMQGHYGMEQTFNAAAHNLSNSSGANDGTPNACPYIKDSTNKGTVYVLSGSAGQLGGQQKGFPHEAMAFSDVTHGGAAMIEVQENKLTLKWICADGVIRDQFTIMKDVNKETTIHAKKGQTVQLKASYVGQYLWKGSNKTSRTIEVKPRVGTAIYTVKDPATCLEDVFIVKVAK